MKTICSLLACLLLAATARSAERPNILWITSEDNGPQLGCYGDKYADTPQIDSLAAKGVIYLNCWSTAPVCAPARTALISGMYPPSTGSQHMRSQVRLPEGFLMYPQLLRQAGYYCTNNSKEDYNLVKPGQVWDESSRKAHWKNRKPNQPFFAVFNHTISHESQIRKRPHEAVHDPAKVRVPAYHPDTPEVRQDWAQYYDKVTQMDALVGKNLKELEEAGLADDTIVFYYGDHGSGMPRSKRWPYNSGLQVPLVVHVPKKFKHLAPEGYSEGGKLDRLVGFVDLAPTLLSLAGLTAPEQIQGHAFMGEHAKPERPYLYGFRGRMDERYDMVRVVRDKRYIYIRNYMPHRIYGQFINYMFQTPTTQVWHDLYHAGKLEAPKTFFWETKPAEELYDLQDDPDEVNNLADSPKHQEIRRRLRKAQQRLALDIRDLGFLPEGQIHDRFKELAPYAMGHSDEIYPIERIMRTAEQASMLKPEAVPALKEALADSDSAVRYWGAMGLLMRGEDAVAKSSKELTAALKDRAPSVRIIAAEALGRYGDDAQVKRALDVLIGEADVEATGVYRAMLALNALDYMDDRAKPVVDPIKSLPRKSDSTPRRMGAYVGNLIDATVAGLGVKGKEKSRKRD